MVLFVYYETHHGWNMQSVPWLRISDFDQSTVEVSKKSNLTALVFYEEKAIETILMTFEGGA